MSLVTPSADGVFYTTTERSTALLRCVDLVDNLGVALESIRA